LYHILILKILKLNIKNLINIKKNDFLFIIINYNKNIMEAINFIKQYNKPYLGNIDYSILDNNKNSYFYYETLINNNIYNYNN